MKDKYYLKYVEKFYTFIIVKNILMRLNQ